MTSRKKSYFQPSSPSVPKISYKFLLLYGSVKQSQIPLTPLKLNVIYEQPLILHFLFIHWINQKSRSCIAREIIQEINLIISKNTIKGSCSYFRLCIAYFFVLLYRFQKKIKIVTTNPYFFIINNATLQLYYYNHYTNQITIHYY